MYYQRRKRTKKNWHRYTAEALALSPQSYEPPERSPFAYYLIGSGCGVLVTVMLFVFNFKLPSPFGEVLLWTVFAFAVTGAGLWLWNWNADRAAIRRGELMRGRDSREGLAERKDEDYYVQPLTPEELESGIPVNKYGKPIEPVADILPINMRGYVIHRTPEMDNVSDWELITNPGTGKGAVKYIGTIGEEHR